jgi:rhodanese-related sulfurtransferase
VATPVDVEEVCRLVGRGGQLVDVLPRRAYEEEHLPGAVSLPLQDLDAQSIQCLDAARPVIAYCYDYQ